ncbi:uncharacterized protein LOC118674788 [Myotis myotis]|uniref:uncharacterized protein LOC118674788 n=1 Tax=Myotis myotis TaxID=51298 RepID=UPI00174B5382|nr:uncharacterized protein LOC118674788 [Myotis myotis]
MASGEEPAPRRSASRPRPSLPPARRLAQRSFAPSSPAPGSRARGGAQKRTQERNEPATWAHQDEAPTNCASGQTRACLPASSPSARLTLGCRERKPWSGVLLRSRLLGRPLTPPSTWLGFQCLQLQTKSCALFRGRNTQGVHEGREHLARHVGPHPALPIPDAPRSKALRPPSGWGSPSIKCLGERHRTDIRGIRLIATRTGSPCRWRRWWEASRKPCLLWPLSHRHPQPGRMLAAFTAPSRVKGRFGEHARGRRRRGWRREQRACP